MSIRRPLPEPEVAGSAAPPPAYTSTINAGAFRAASASTAARPQSAVVPPSENNNMYADTRPLNYRPQTMHATGSGSGSSSGAFLPPPGSPPQLQQQTSYKQPPPQSPQQFQHGRTPSMQSQQAAPLARSNTREDPLSVRTYCRTSTCWLPSLQLTDLYWHQ
jgi:hypothetical protein